MTYLSQLEQPSDLEICSLSEVTSAGMTALASGCRKLSELDMKNCGNISDAGFWSLAYDSWNLKQINIRYCAVSDVGICNDDGEFDTPAEYEAGEPNTCQ